MNEMQFGVLTEKVSKAAAARALNNLAIKLLESMAVPAARQQQGLANCLDAVTHGEPGRIEIGAHGRLVQGVFEHVWQHERGGALLGRLRFEVQGRTPGAQNVFLCDIYLRGDGRMRFADAEDFGMMANMQEAAHMTLLVVVDALQNALDIVA